jgi:hypothetical protein
MTYDPNSGYPYPPQPPKPPKSKVGKILGIGCGGVLALALVGGCMAAISSGSGDDDKSSSTPTPKVKVSASTAGAVSKECTDDVYDMLIGQVKGEKLPDSRPGSCDGLTDKQWSQTVSDAGDKAKAAGDAALADTPEPEPTKDKPKVVTFKVWGTAPAGVLGSLDITYGSDSDNLKGTFKNGEFKATLPLDDDAMYYDVSAQLQGSGDIHCSVTVDGETDKGHAAGDYNICSAQLSSGFLGGWE